MKHIVRFFLIGSVSFCLFVGTVSHVMSDTNTPTPTPSSSDIQSQTTDLQNKIQEYQQKIADLQGAERTLSSQISILDNQIQLSEYKIQAAQTQIKSLEADIAVAEQKIAQIQKNIDDQTQILISRIVAVYEVGDIPKWQAFLTSNTVSNFLTRLGYLKIVQAYDKKMLYSNQQAKMDYANEQAILEEKQAEEQAVKQQLESYSNQLDQQKSEKADLLKETQGSEAGYQKLLAQAKAQLAALANFAQIRASGGETILPHQDLSDSWGKYYNQRDSNWGNNFINNSSEKIWEVGCLLTSYTMVSDHFGSSVTPADVAANSSDFWLNTAYFLLPGPSANGHSVNYVSNPSLDTLRSDLNNGGVVIAGMSSNGGPYPLHYSDHWVVLRSVNADGSFQINDPWYPGAMNVNLNDHYSGWTIIEARIYQ